VDGYTTGSKECGMTLPIVRSTGTTEHGCLFSSCSSFRSRTIYQVLEKWFRLKKLYLDPRWKLQEV
jgi:hypothetical protein